MVAQPGKRKAKPADPTAPQHRPGQSPGPQAPNLIVRAALSVQKGDTPMEKQDEARAIEMTAGTAGNLAEALDQWENEREMINQLHDENQAYTTALRRFDIAMVLAGKVIDAVERDAAM